VPNARIKTLLVLTSTAGGAGKHAYYLARDLPRDVFDLTVAFGPGYPLDPEFARLDVAVVHLRLSRSLAPRENLAAFVQLLRLMRSNRFDLVCAACSIAGLVGRLAAWISGVPKRVFIIHAFASHPHQPRFARWMYHGIEKMLDPFTTRYIAVSEAIQRFGIEARLFKPEKVDVVLNGIALSEPLDASPEQTRAELGIPIGAPLIATAGRFEPQKGLHDLIEAVALVRKELPEARLLLIGDGPLRENLQECARQKGVSDAVLFTGWRNDVPRLIQASDVFCLSSHWESFGLVLVEAMALGKPVVATGVDGIPEVVEHERTGLLVPARQPQALAVALVELLADPARARRMGEAGRKRVHEHFRLEDSIERFVEVLKRHVGWSGVKERSRACGPAKDRPIPANAES